MQKRLYDHSTFIDELKAEKYDLAIVEGSNFYEVFPRVLEIPTFIRVFPASVDSSIL